MECEWFYIRIEPISVSIQIIIIIQDVVDERM